MFDKPSLYASGRLTRRRVVAGAAFAAALTAIAHADQPAEEFVGRVLQEANAGLGAASEAERSDAIERLVNAYADLDRTAVFALGQYARQITPEQRQEYLPLFRRYATTIYQSILADYQGEQLAVSGSVDRSARDIIVNSRIVNAAAGSPLANVTIHWRVYRAPSGEQAIIDAGADGVWLAIEQQSQFKAVIANNGGGSKGIDALVADLKTKVGA